LEDVELEGDQCRHPRTGFSQDSFLSFKDTGFERVIWINLAQDMVDWL